MRRLGGDGASLIAPLEADSRRKHLATNEAGSWQKFPPVCWH